MAGREYTTEQYAKIKNFGKEVAKVGSGIETSGNTLQYVGEYRDHDPEQIVAVLDRHIAQLQRLMHDIVVSADLRPGHSDVHLDGSATTEGNMDFPPERI